MVVGVDARHLGALRVGIGNVLLHLLEGVGRIRPDISFTLFSDREVRPVPGNCHAVVVAPVQFGRGSTCRRLAVPLWHSVRLPAAIRRTGVDVFYSPNYLIPLNCSCPAVVTVHDMSAWRDVRFHGPIYSAYLRAFMPSSVARADRVVLGSEWARSELLSLLPVSSDRLRVIRHGVTAPRTNRVTRVGKADLVYVGTMERRKNVVGLLRAFELVRSHGIDSARLSLVGKDGLGVSEIRRAARTSRYADAISFEGYVSEERLEGFYAGASVFCYCSFYEGFGLPVLEAMARGVPVVCSDIPVFHEVAGDAALFADPLNPLGIAVAIERVLADGALSECLAERGRLRAQQFSWDDSARALSAVFDELA